MSIRRSALDGRITVSSSVTGGSVWSVDRIADVTGDGINDVLAGSWSNFVYCLDGVTGGQEHFDHVTVVDVLGDFWESHLFDHLKSPSALIDQRVGFIRVNIEFFDRTADDVQGLL